MPTSLHGEELCFDAGMRRADGEPFVALHRKGDGLVWFAVVKSEVAQTSKDMCAKLMIVAGPGEAESSAKVLICNLILASVVGHPSGHLGQSSGRAEDATLLLRNGAAKELGSDRVLEIAGDRRIEVCAADQTVGATK